MTSKKDDDAAVDSKGLERAEGLYQQIADLLLAEIEEFDKIPFGDLPNIEQSRTRIRIKNLAQKVVFEAIRIVHDEGAPSVAAVVKSVNVKTDAIAISLHGAPGQRDRHVLADAAGREVTLVITDAAKYFDGPDDDGEDETSTNETDPGSGDPTSDGEAGS